MPNPGPRPPLAILPSRVGTYGAATCGSRACFDADGQRTLISLVLDSIPLRVLAEAFNHRVSGRPRFAAVVALLVLIATLAAVLLWPAGGPSSASAQAFGAKPNIIVLLTDDQETRSMRVMKIVGKELKRKGVTMKRFYDNFPLCCPARATIFTGQYAHNHHVLSNVPPDGGYGVFNELHGDNYLPLWLQGAGYQTSYIGKFENGYAEPDEYGTVPSDVPKGWNDWHVLAPSRAQYFNYTLNQNGVLRQFTDAEEDYSTDIFTKKARRFIRTNAQAATPFYLELGYAAPHGGGGGDPGRSCNRAAVPAPRHLGTLKKKAKGNLPPSFNEAEISDKPTPIADNASLTDGQISDTLRKRRCAWESLLAVDESVGTLINELKRDKLRRNTYIFYLSDNGFMRGEHRIRGDKRFLYEESARVPFIARGPGIPHGESSNDVVVNADLTSTILELSGAQAGLLQDGQSLIPSLAGPEPGARPRDSVRGLRRRADPRGAHLALHLRRMGHRRAAAREGALRHLPRPVSADQPRQLRLLPGGGGGARCRARRPDRLRRRELSRGADGPAHLHHGRRQERLRAAAGRRPLRDVGRQPGGRRLLPRRQGVAGHRHGRAVRGRGAGVGAAGRAAGLSRGEGRGAVHRR